MEKIKISKELVSAVLGKEIPNVNTVIKIDESETVLNYDKECGCCNENINLYEFAFKCKEWAFNNGGYVLQSQSYVVKDYKFAKGAFCYTHFPMGGIGNSHWADTEVEAIIKACEWILNNAKN